MARREDALVGRKLKTSYITTVVSITLVLFVLGLLGMVLLNANMLSNHVKENLGFSIVLVDNAPENQVNALLKKLDAMPAVKSSEFVSSDDAAKELQEELGEDFISFLGYNPLFPSIDVKLNAAYANPDSLKVFESSVMENNIAREVSYQENLVSMVNDNVKKISIALIAFSFLLLLIAIALINNTIRLSVFSKRFLIKSMQLVGATQSFIRRPFVIKGVIQGFTSAVISILLLVALLFFIEKQAPDIATLQNTKMIFIIFVGITFIGIVISWVSTHFAVKKYLGIKTDELFLY
jgi:cell division transport system permease protein